MSSDEYLYKGMMENDSIALYKAEAVWLDQLETVQGYLHAADLIIKSINEQYNIHGKTDAIDDQLALPLLNLYIHSLEISLKLLINRLIQHESNNCCSFKLRIDVSILKNTLLRHDMHKIISDLDNILPIAGELHHFEAYADIRRSVLELYDRGISSESSRYSTDTKGRTAKLRLERVNIRIFKVHMDVNKYCQSIFNYIDESIDNDLNECERAEFTDERLGELKKCKEILKMHEDIFKSAIDPVENGDQFAHYKVVSAVEILSEPLSAQEKVLNESLKKMEKEELSYLTMGLYFTLPITTIPSLQNIRLRDKEQLEEKVFERSGVYNNALIRLDQHIRKVEMIKNKIDKNLNDL